jgi:hypothetical protein
MLPAAYATPVAMIFVVGGLLACFAGYRLFRVVLGIYGFIFGAAITTSIMGAAGTLALVVAAVVGGLVGAVLMVAAYFIGVGLIGAGLAALALNAAWHALRHAEPPTVVLVIVSVIGALAALSIVRYVVVFGTALSGSWTTLAGALALAGNRIAAVKQTAPHAAADVLVVYPLNPLPPRWWAYAAWLGLALAGVVVQLATTSKLAGPKKAPAKK